LPLDSKQETNTIGNSISKEIDIRCEDESCSSITNYYECSSGSCSSGSSCIWAQSTNQCECSHHQGSCLNLCRPNHGTCLRDQCPYPNTFHQPTGDQWCIDDRGGSQDYMCCCNVPTPPEDTTPSQPETQTPTPVPKMLPKEPIKQVVEEPTPTKLPTKQLTKPFTKLTSRVVSSIEANTFNLGMLILAIFTVCIIAYVGTFRKK